jgi:release factor glutamine methyltransferase
MILNILKNSIHHYPGLSERRLREEFDLLKTRAQLSGETFSHESLWEKLEKYCETGRPLEHLSEERFFFDGAYFVSPDCLIPRSETEILVEQCLEKIKMMKGPISMCEIGVGSGAVFLSILRNCEKEIDFLGTDISAEAMRIAKWNSFLKKNSYSPKHQLNFCLTDRLDGIDRKFHLILSNPPYIKRNHTGIHSQVETYEPHLALFIDSDYDQWFEKFFRQVHAALHPQGYFLMEGHESELEHLKNLSSAQAFTVREIKKDYTGRDRFLIFNK